MIHPYSDAHVPDTASLGQHQSSMPILFCCGMIRFATGFERDERGLKTGREFPAAVPEYSPVAEFCRTELTCELRCQFSYAFKVGHQIVLDPQPVLRIRIERHGSPISWLGRIPSSRH